MGNSDHGNIERIYRKLKTSKHGNIKASRPESGQVFLDSPYEQIVLLFERERDTFLLTTYWSEST